MNVLVHCISCTCILVCFFCREQTAQSPDRVFAWKASRGCAVCTAPRRSYPRSYGELINCTHTLYLSIHYTSYYIIHIYFVLQQHAHVFTYGWENSSRYMYSVRSNLLLKLHSMSCMLQYAMYLHVHVHVHMYFNMLVNAFFHESESSTVVGSWLEGTRVVSVNWLVS